MRAVSRSDVPAPRVLTDPDAPGPRELARARAHFAAATGRGFDFKIYGHDEVKAALRALFHGKCAYCESFYDAQAPVDVEHFRPKGKIEDAPGHPGYWWLAMAWDNLLPSCIDCNRKRRQPTPDPGAGLAALADAALRTVNTGKQDSFPVAGPRATGEGDSIEDEAALLLDPARDRPEDHLAFALDADLPALLLPRAPPGIAPALPALGNSADVAAAALSHGLSVRGAVSIQVFGLNRLGLVQERTRVLRKLEFLRRLIEDLDQVVTDLGAEGSEVALRAAGRIDGLTDRILDEIRAMAAPERPYSALVHAWLHQFLAEISTEP